MFCKECGAVLKDDAKFCGKCGRTIVASKSEKAPADTVNEAADATVEETEKCPECGAELKKSASFCGKCGAKTSAADSENAAGNTLPAVAVTQSSDNDNNNDNEDKPETTEDSSETTETAGVIGFLAIPRVLVLIAIICFFFPFMTVSCGATGMDISGTDMIFGNDEIVEYVENATDDNDASLFNWFILIAGICSLTGLIITNHKDAAIYSSLSSAFLIVFRITAEWYYSIGDTPLSETDGMIRVDYGGALYAAIILQLIAAGIYLFIGWARNEKSELRE